MAASEELRRALGEGLVIPAHPLALTAERRLDERRQRALTRYYAEAGAGGIAVGVHSTQFGIRGAGLFEPVLQLAATTAAESERRGGRALVRIAGAIGPTPQAVAEAETARRLGYDAVLLSLGALRDASLPELVAHCRRVAEVRPLIGFYLQPAVGGRPLGEDFWRALPRDRRRRGDQGRPLQPLPDARRGARAGRERPRLRGRALHGQRRRDRARPARRVPRRAEGALRGRPAGPVGRLDAARGGAARRGEALSARRRQRAPSSSWRSGSS